MFSLSKEEEETGDRGGFFPLPKEKEKVNEKFNI